MEFKDLMNALAENAGVTEGFPPDEDGVVRVGRGNLELAFMEIPEKRALLVWSPIGVPPEEGADALKTDLLKANFMGRDVNGGTLSLSDDGEAYLHQILQLDLLDKATFLQALELKQSKTSSGEKRVGSLKQSVVKKTSGGFKDKVKLYQNFFANNPIGRAK